MSDPSLESEKARRHIAELQHCIQGYLELLHSIRDQRNSQKSTLRDLHYEEHVGRCKLAALETRVTALRESHPPSSLTLTQLITGYNQQLSRISSMYENSIQDLQVVNKALSPSNLEAFESQANQGEATVQPQTSPAPKTVLDTPLRGGSGIKRTASNRGPDRSLRENEKGNLRAVKIGPQSSGTLVVPASIAEVFSYSLSLKPRA